MGANRRTALVTGGATRIGRAIVLELARAGCDIAVHFRRSHTEALETASAAAAMGRRATTVEADLNDPTSWSAVVERTVGELGGLDILINNASVFDAQAAARAHFGPRIDRPFDAMEWELMFRVNAIAPAGLSYQARPHLRASGCGRIVNLCDIAADRPWADCLSYCASKAALVALTKGLARAFAPSVTVNGVSPGIAVFPDSYPPPLRQKLVARVPLEREGSPEEVARLVRFLVESGDYVTGQIIAIDGGRSVI